MSSSSFRQRQTRIRRARKPLNCEACRHSKLRCDRQCPCATCIRRDLADSCVYRNAPPRLDPVSTNTTTRSRRRRTEQPVGDTSSRLSPRPEREGLPSFQSVENRAASDSHARWDEIFQRPTDQMGPSSSDKDGVVSQLTGPCFPFSLGPAVPKQNFLAQLPSKECCDYLIIQYFSRLSPLFHILHGPTFQQQYSRFISNPADVELSWLALLFIICSTALNTIEEKDPIVAKLISKDPDFQDFPTVAAQLRNCAMICLSQDQFFIRHSLHTLETILILIYGMSHSDGVERTWVLLGTALNIGIALRCNLKSKPPSMGWIEFERRRRCWAGVLMLHTYQAILFRDVRVSYLLDMEPSLPADVNDCDIHDDKILQPSSQPTQMSMIMFKLRLFELSSRICDHLSTDAKLDESRLVFFDSLIAQEQAKWDAKFLLDGEPSVLDVSSYAHWCFLQQYAHQLYLLLHRAFCRPRSGKPPRAESQSKCIASGAALLEIHRRFYELPRLRHYRWYVYGMTSFCALHGAVALASCLLMEPALLDSSPYRATFENAVARFDKLRSRSQICAKSYPIILHLQAMLSPQKSHSSNDSGVEFSNVFDEWIDTVPWLNVDSVNWEAWNDVLNETSQ